MKIVCLRILLKFYNIRDSNEETRKFDSLPLSSRTISALNDAKLTILTEIQSAAIPHALAGRDILGAV